MVEAPSDVAGVQRDRRGVDPFRRCLGAGGRAGGLALADPQVEAGALDELAFVGIALDDCRESVGGGLEVVALERPDAALVHRDGFVEARLSGRRRRVRPLGGALHREATARAVLEAGALATPARARRSLVRPASSPRPPPSTAPTPCAGRPGRCCGFRRFRLLTRRGRTFGRLAGRADAVSACSLRASALGDLDSSKRSSRDGQVGHDTVQGSDTASHHTVRSFDLIFRRGLRAARTPRATVSSYLIAST